MADHNDPDRGGPLPSSPESAGYFSPPAGWVMRPLISPAPTIRERAFDAAQCLVLSDPCPPTGFLAQNRIVKRILELAGEFEEWMLKQPEIDLRTELSEQDRIDLECRLRAAGVPLS